MKLDAVQNQLNTTQLKKEKSVSFGRINVSENNDTFYYRMAVEAGIGAGLGIIYQFAKNVTKGDSFRQFLSKSSKLLSTNKTKLCIFAIDSAVLAYGMFEVARLATKAIDKLVKKSD